MSKIKIIALFGKAGSGKDALLHAIMNRNIPTLHEIISCTTRPPREGEQHGVNYYFLSVEEFTHKVLNGDMLEATEFRDWFYGTALDALNPNAINIGVFNPAGLKALIEDTRLEVLCVGMRASDKTRLLRQLGRESNPDVSEICRRYFADEQDFGCWELDSEEYEQICYLDNENRDIEDTASSLEQIISLFSAGEL